MTVVVVIAMGLLGISVVLSLKQIRTAHEPASAAVVGDLIFFSGIGLLVLLSMLRDSSAVVEAALLASLLGILSTIALARIITRGRR